MQEKIKPFGLILLFWIVALFIINPIGDFPLNDDWAYALSVKNWLDNGAFKIIDWPAMSLFSHVAWGTFWTTIFGFSFTVLRFSVFLLAAFSIWIFSLLLKELNFSWEQQLIALATLVFNPIYFYLSNTFMTDVSFLAFCIFSAYGFFRYFKSEKWYWWVAAIACSILAILVRQLGLLIPIAFGGAMVLRSFSIKKISTAIAGVLITFGSLQGYMFWLENTTGLPNSFVSIDSVLGQLRPSIFFARAKELLGFYGIYLGGFLLPIWVLTTTWFKDRFYLILFLIGLPILAFFTIPCWDKLPLWNTLFDFGIGPINLTDFIRGHSTATALSFEKNLLIKLSAYLGSVLLLWNIVQGIKRVSTNRKTKSPLFFFKLGVLFFTISYLLYLITDKYNFDRYLLPVFVFSFFLLPASKEKRIWPALVFLLPILFFTVAGTHDYLAWNKARWKGLNALKRIGIKPSQIDGGFEFNGWHQTHDLNPDNQFSKSWWFVDDDEYAIGFTPYKNYEVLAPYPFKRLLTFEKDSILLLQRTAVPKKTTILNSSNTGLEDSLYIRYKKEDYLTDILPENLKTSNSNSSEILHINPAKEYSLPHLLYPVKPFEKISMSFDLFGNRRSLLVVNTVPKTDAFYHAHLPYIIERDKDNWQETVVEMEIPKDFPSDTLKIYFWKQDQEASLFIRDLKLEWKRF